MIGSIGHSSHLYGEVSSDTTDNVLTLPEEQFSRSFSIISNSCTPIDFTIYALQSTIPQNGTLHLSLSPNSGHHLQFNFDECPVGFTLQNVNNGSFACTCGEIFNKSPIKDDFLCNPLFGKIERKNGRSWLSVSDDSVEYMRLCLPGYCQKYNDDKISENQFSLTDHNVLCTHSHVGRACRGCDHVVGNGRTFGSTECEKCENTWFLTILLYVVLGIILVLIIHLLKLTVTMGTINGLIFFCNIMGINESLIFHHKEFSLIKIFISLVNLDLGFKICFYSEMSQIAKTGLQFVFPIYLWLLMFVIIMVEKYCVRMHIRKSTRSSVPVLATLILLSYSKILRTTISVFSSVNVYCSKNDSDYSELDQIVAWQPDPDIKYCKDEHVPLFLVAMVFTVLFVIPFAFALTFPKVVLRSRKLSYFFPLLDSIYAPYTNNYRYWFGLRIIVLIFLSTMESALFQYQESLLFSAVVAVFLFAFVQAYVHPFKIKINNILDLMFMGIFIILGIVILFLNSNMSDYEDYTYNIAVNTLGGVGFLLFCVIIIFHLQYALHYLTWYSKFTEALKIKFNIKNIKGDWNPLLSIDVKDIDVNQKPTNDNSNYAYLQESLLEERFN